MQIENSFDVPVRVADAWIVLTDIERIVPCMPGAALKEVVDDSTYKGAVSIRLGPVSLTFDGTARFEEIDETTYRAWVKTQGRDTKGRGSVMADVRFELQPVENTTKVLVHTDFRLSGAVAQYGRGAGMISDVASRWLEEFSECLRMRLEAQGVGVPEAVAVQSAQPIPGIRFGLAVLRNAIVRRVRRVLGRE